EALGRKRKNLRSVTVSGDQEVEMVSLQRDPEERAQDEEHRQLLRRAIDSLPEHFRTVFVLRQVQELSIEETARCLELRPETVKTRLDGARNRPNGCLVDYGVTGGLPFA